MVFIGIQLLGLVAWLCGLASFWEKNKKKILFVQIVGDVFYVFHYLLLNAITGGIIIIIDLSREMLFFGCKNEKQEKAIFYILLPIYFLVGCLLADGVIEIFPILASITYCYTLTMAAYWVVIGGIIDSAYWLFYDILCGSYVGVITDIIMIVSNAMAALSKKKVINSKQNV